MSGMFPCKFRIFSVINIPVLKLIAEDKLLFKDSTFCNSSLLEI